MRAFVFRLQRVLNTKRQECELVRRRLRLVAHECAKARDNLTAYTRRIARVAARLGRVPAGVLTPGEVLRHKAYINRLRQERRDVAHGLLRLEALRRQVLEEMQRIRQEIEKMATIRDRRLAAYARELDRREQQQLDEASLRKFSPARARLPTAEAGHGEVAW